MKKETLIKNENGNNANTMSTVVIEHTRNFIHLKTNHVPQWVHKLEELNKKIISELNCRNKK